MAVVSTAFILYSVKFRGDQTQKDVHGPCVYGLCVYGPCEHDAVLYRGHEHLQNLVLEGSLESRTSETSGI